MSGRTSFVDTLRAIDDANLDVYEFRLWVHIWRVGASWESLRTLAEKCDMSLGKMSQAKKSLLERNLLAYTEHKGRLALTAVLCSPDEQCSPHEQTQHSNRSPDEQNVHDMNTSVHHMNTDVHHMNAILSIPLEVDLTKGEEEIAREAVTPPPAKSSPPPIVKHQSTDRTPGGNGYRPPTEPPPRADGDPPKPQPSAEVVAVGELANAITEVTGVSAKLNWKTKDGTGVGDLAEDLHRAGYTAEQIREHYGPRKVAERWHWFESDWRGKKGDKPRLKEIRETIALAVTEQPGKPQQESGQSWLEQSLKLARANGLLPQN